MASASDPLRTYIDTSVFGGAFDPEYQRPSQQFFSQVRRDLFRVVISPVLEREVQDAPAAVQTLFDEISSRSELQPITAEVDQLARAYLDAGILGEKSALDAYHVALATVSRCTLLVSWNFRHLVSFYRAPLYNAVNTLHGYPHIAIKSPPEVLIDDDANP